MQRIGNITAHLAQQIPNKDEDIVIVSALRTPICKASRGHFKDTLPEKLLATVLKATIDKSGINPSLVDDIVVGNVLPVGGGATVARMAMLAAGFPVTTAISTVNRQCSSGLQAVASIAAAIKSGHINIGIGAGVESMTMNYGPSAMPASFDDDILSNESSAKCLMPMGEISDLIAERFQVSRLDQDRFAADSHRKAATAQKLGFFQDEIVPVDVVRIDEKGHESRIRISQDDGIREGTTVEKLSKLRSAFSSTGTTTAGNSSQVSDGAAAVLLMKRSMAKTLGLNVLATFDTFATIGVAPEIMGVGPLYAIPAALRKVGLSLDDVDIFEINEAFASQAFYCVKALGIPFEKVNPNGGAIALGHPLGCTGNRQIATLIYELKRKNMKTGVISMCVGTGMGAAAVITVE